MDCIFCKIIDGDIPSYKIYEDEYVLAFLDITQTTKGHTLVIPKKHYKNIFDTPKDIAEKVFSVVPKIANALKETFNPIGINIVNNNDQPLQSVFHLHIHLIPRYEDDQFNIKFTNNMATTTQEDMIKIANQIKHNI
jgi:histidine triad (HIT) family protein